MTEKRYYAHKHLLEDNEVHDKICHNFMGLNETVEHMNNEYWKYKQLKKENLDLSEELDYYKAKCASLETGLFQADKENKQLKMENKELKLLVQSWEALDEEKDEQLDRQNQSLKKLVKENAQLKQLINDKEVDKND